MRRYVLFLLVAFAVFGLASAQDSISKGAPAVSIDGSVDKGEYQYSKTVSGMTISVSIGKDGLVYLATEAKTSGWVALGVGGRVMNGSRLFLAYDSNGKRFFTEQAGAGHSHGDAQDRVVTKWAVKSANGSTTLELALPYDKAVESGILNVLFSYSTGLDMTAHHSARGSFGLTVKE
jgi:hypothetical protein